MKQLSLKVIALAGASVIGIAWVYDDSGAGTSETLVGQTNMLSDNDPVFMSGCQSHHGPVAPKIVFPTVNKNFVTRLCALEVPPSNIVVAQQRLNWGLEQ